jgi:hypothetical protein
VVADWPGSPLDEQRIHERFADRRLEGEWFDDADRSISSYACELEAAAS